MKFNRVPEYALEGMAVPHLGSTSATATILAHNYRAIWLSSCRRVLIVAKHWHTIMKKGIQCDVSVYAGATISRAESVVGIQCKIDGSEAFVANEVVDSLADYEFEEEGELLERLVNLRADLTDGGKEEVTLSRYYRYRERKEAAHEV